jgi:Aspartyl protease
VAYLFLVKHLKALVDHTTALAELLSQHGFHRHPLVRNQIGRLQLVGVLYNAAVDILLDTGAASTVIDLSYCRAKGIPTRDTGKLGGGAGGITLAIHALDGVTLSLDGRPLRSDGIYAVDLTHVNEGLITKGASRVQGVLGADVLTYHQAVIDYATMSLFLHHPNA